MRRPPRIAVLIALLAAAAAWVAIDLRGPDRQCGKVLVIENERIAGRICVVMIGAALGY